MFRHVLLLTSIIAFLGMSEIRAAEKVDYLKQIQPIFMKRCAGCHGEKKGLGKMRLHTVAALKKKWAAKKNLIVPGKPGESELCKRLVLPADSKKRMPKKADPLPKAEIALIATWIKQGAVLPAAATVEAHAEPAKTAKTKAKKSALPEVESASQEAVDRLMAAGAQVMPLFAGSSLLQVSFARRDTPAGDAEIALLADVAEQVFSLDLSGATATDQGYAQLAKLTNLMQLHLERSSVTDAALAALGGLGRLEYLNLYGTAVSDAGLAQLENLKHLRKLFLWETKVTYDAAEALAKKIPGLEFDLGYNNPVVVRKRLTKQLELAKKQAAESTASLKKSAQQVAQAQQQLEQAKHFDQAKKQFEQVKKQFAQSQQQFEQEKKKFAQAEKKLAQAKQQLEQAQQQLAQAKKLEEARKQLEQAKKQLQETEQQLVQAKKLAQAKQQLEQTKQQQKAAAARIAEIEKQLKELDKPAQPSGDQAEKTKKEAETAKKAEAEKKS